MSEPEWRYNSEALAGPGWEMVYSKNPKRVFAIIYQEPDNVFMLYRNRGISTEVLEFKSLQAAKDYVRDNP